MNLSRVRTLLPRFLAGRYGISQRCFSIAAQHPLHERASCPTLTAEERVLTFLAGHTAAGKIPNVIEDWKHLPEEFHASGLEVILQTHLFAGYPRTLNAFTAVHSVGVTVDPATLVEDGDPQEWKRRGEENCSKIYGNVYTSLRKRISELHPVLDTYMIELGYGRVLGRPGLSLRMRELCVLAVLCGQDVAPQLNSHLRGAILVGATQNEVAAVVNATKHIWNQVSVPRLSPSLCVLYLSRAFRRVFRVSPTSQSDSLQEAHTQATAVMQRVFK